MGNALTWTTDQRFDVVHVMELSVVPAPRRAALVDHLLSLCAPGGRLVIGPHNDLEERESTADALVAMGRRVAGRIEHPHRRAGVVRRLVWLEA